MKKLWQWTGRVAFWVSWPLLFIYLRFGKRTRVLIVHKDSVLMTHSWLSDGKWALPGGGLHHGENIQAGAVREVFEETGIKLNPAQLKLLGKNVSSKYGLRFAYEQFVVELNEQQKLKPQRFEIVELEWISIRNLNEKNTETASLDTIARWQQQA